jgi:hypothetical protein
MRPRHPEPTGQLRRRQPPGQVDQGERVPARLGDDLVAHRLVEHRRDLGGEERAGVPVAKAVNLQLRQVPQLFSGLARGEHDPDGFCQEAPGHERERQRRRLVNPLRVVDDTKERALLRHLGEQAEDGQADEEAIWGITRALPEHGLERLTLRGRKRLEPVEQRTAELMEGCEGQLHLRLDTARAHNRRVGNGLDQVLKQCRLSDPGLPAQHQ